MSSVKHSSSSTFRDLWSIALEVKKSMDMDKKQATTNEGQSSILLLGNRSAGKTTIALRLIERNDSPRSTTGLEYVPCFKQRGAEMGRDVAHLWELAGGTFLSKIIDVVVTMETIHRLAIVIVLDLSRPEELWNTLESLLNQVRSRVSKVMSNLKSVEPELVQHLVRQSWQEYGKDHPDKDLVTPLPVPLAIIGTKYDIFQDFEPEKKKIISKTLRFLAHTNGATLYYYSDKLDQLVSKTKQLLTQYAFNGPPANTVSMDYNKPLLVPVGSDSLGNIGVPSLSSGGNLGKISNARSPFELWKQAFCGYFSQATSDKVYEDPCKDTKYREEAIDTLRKQKDEELEKYRRQCELLAKKREKAGP